MTPTPRSGDQGTEGEVRGRHDITVTWLHGLVAAWFYLDLLFHVVEDEPLGMYEVVGGVERHGVQRPAVHAATVHRPASRF